MSFFDELKRRNVFKVGIAYAVGAWLLLQMTEVLSELLNLPEVIGPVVVAVVAIGFPIAVFFAWAFEMTPEGVKRESDVDRTQSITPQTGKKLNNAILLMMALAIVYLLYDKFSGDAPSIDPNEPATAAVNPADRPGEAASQDETAINPKSIAVLPFANRSNLQEDEFFVEGVHDDLLTNLARIGELKVISRTSVLRYKDTERPIPEIAGELNVATVMEGAVQRAGNTVRINVQLIDAATDEHLWADIFDREMTAENLFAIQSEISGKIAEALKATLSPEEQQRVNERPTENLAAYNAYLRGRQLEARRTSESLDQASIEFGRAVELDPDFALAWVGVADTAQLRTGYSNLNINESLAIREEAVANAMALNDQLGEAHLSQAMLHAFRDQHDEAEASFRKAIELSPNYARAYQWYADFMSRQPQRFSESLEMTRKALELDPLSSIMRYEVAEKLINLGRFPEAERSVRELMEMDPDFPVATAAMSTIAAATGRFDEQVRWMRKRFELDPGDISSYPDLVFTMLDLGNTEAVADIRKTMETIDDQHFSIGILDMWDGVYHQNYAAALETGNWVNEQIGRLPGFQWFIGYLQILQGNYPQAREAFENAEPRFFDVATMRDAIQAQASNGCAVGWLMQRTGDQEQGDRLIGMTLEYLEDELPQYIEHADRYGYEDCYLIRGEIDKALDAWEIRVAHGHVSGWWINSMVPWFEPIRGNSRYEAAIQQVRDRIALQRENLARMEAAET